MKSERKEIIRGNVPVLKDILFLMRSVCSWTDIVDEVDLYQGTQCNVSEHWERENSKIFQRGRKIGSIHKFRNPNNFAWISQHQPWN